MCNIVARENYLNLLLLLLFKKETAIFNAREQLRNVIALKYLPHAERESRKNSSRHKATTEREKRKEEEEVCE